MARAQDKLTWRVSLDRLRDQIPLTQRYPSHLQRVLQPANDMLMDTLGLSALGLPDVQCHFRDLDPSQVAQVLYNTAVYIYDNGAVIDSGHTVAGIQPEEKWHCQFEESLLKPHREVLDVNPGPEHAAGQRSEGE